MRRIIELKVLPLILVFAALFGYGCGDSSANPNIAAPTKTAPSNGGTFRLSDINGNSLTNSNSPDAVLFWHFLQSLYIDSVKPNGARRRLLSPGLTGNSDEDWISQYFVERYLLVNHEVRLAKREALSCDDHLRGSFSDGLLEMINGLDQVEMSVYGKHLAIVSVQLDAGRRFNIVKAIRNSPSVFQRNFTKKTTDASIDDNLATAVVESMCESLLNEFDHEVESSTGDKIETISR